MAYAFGIQIDGVEIPPPSGYSFTESDLVVNSRRNANGVASWDVVRQNVGQLELEWQNLTQERIQRIASAIRGKKKFSARFFNIGTGAWETRTFYPGDRAMSLVRFISASRYWANISIPFVEV